MITCGFGFTVTQNGTRKWYMSKDGVKRWLDNDQPCSGTQCFDCEFVISKKQHDGKEAMA